MANSPSSDPVQKESRAELKAKVSWHIVDVS
jgi:hypothetical protein